MLISTIILAIIQSVCSILIAIITFKYVNLTGEIVKNNSQLLKEIQHQKLNSWRPFLVPTSIKPLLYTNMPEKVEFDIENRGLGPAINITIEYEPGTFAMELTKPNVSFLPHHGEKDGYMSLVLQAPRSNATRLTRNEENYLGNIKLKYNDANHFTYETVLRVSFDAENKVQITLINQLTPFDEKIAEEVKPNKQIT